MEDREKAELAETMPQASEASAGLPPMPNRVPVEEYQLLFETTERVIDRRVALNSWNYGVCVAILASMGLVIDRAVTQPGLLGPALAWVAVASCTGLALSWYWRARILDLKALNTAKFEVLNAMAPNVDFGRPNNTSAEPFRREWVLLDEAKKLRRGASRRGFVGLASKVLNSSGAETLLPTLFAVLFFLAIVYTTLVSALHWESIRANLFDLGGDNREKAQSPVIAPTGSAIKNDR
jgi:hypothetical protein